MKPLVISFTGALYAIKSGRLSPGALDTALFYLGCIRDHALNPGANDEYNEVEMLSEDKNENRRVHGILVAALKKAEKEGRVEWRTLKQPNTYGALNRLLVKNGFQQIEFGVQSHYNYPTVETAVQEQGLPLEVVWRG